MENLPLYISLSFAIIALITAFILYKASSYSKTVLIVLIIWFAAQAKIALPGFYLKESTIPPRFMLLVLPPLLFIIILFLTKKGKQFIDSLNLKTLTILHVIRVGGEVVLFWLCINKVVPQLMTFEGRNFDILSGLSAPFIYYFGFIKKKLSPQLILAWNIICLILLLNIAVNAIFSAPLPFQKFAFDQPNIALLYFPFNWLPSCVVPIVLFAHLAAIRQLILRKNLK